MANKNLVLIVDDDPVIGVVLGDILKDEGYKTLWFANGSDALDRLDCTNGVDLVLMDLLLPGIDGLEALKRIVARHSSLPVIMMSGHGTIQTAVEATRLGAFDWLEKPLDMNRVLLTIRNALERRKLLREKEAFLDDARLRYRMVGESPKIKKVFELIDRVASKNTTVLITGESGTGKELVAHAIHLNSLRAAFPFVRMNCAAVPETLIESELFGYCKGAFTGALGDHKGKFQQADNGTLFMDEIGDLSSFAQAKVLRAIDTGEFERVGAEKSESVDIRFLSATNRKLEDMVRAGSFREDLFHRIHVITIAVPPLRERSEDILPLAAHFMEEHASANHVGIKRFTSDAEAVLLGHSWPGNVRELKNFIEKLMVFVETPEVNGSQIDSILHSSSEPMIIRSGKTFKLAKENFERNIILQTLKSGGWNLSKTAEELQMPRSLLYKKIKKFGINIQKNKAPE